ncbi:MAG TPA: response regulator [Stellaceae bacterium]|jgi:two-component system chemotaxis response regulator CheB|nr:response regulator [Stellaceae bacterium]
MSKKQILVVDDSFIMRTIIKDIVESDPDLQVAGFAENGKVGLQRMRELKPDAILLDLEMPEMSGLDMLKRLMLLGKAKVIVVSSVGQTGSPQALEARRLGAVDVIAKPSGAMSLDLQAKKGHEIVQSLRRALQLDPAPGA